MPYAQKVIAEHRGSIAVESTPGAGTTVRVELPAAATDGK
jgi:signal transduction histidine kinase